MRLVSNVNLDGFNYFLVLDDTRGAMKWILYSEIHPSKYTLTGPEQFEDALTLTKLSKSSNPEYVVESLVRSKKTGVSKVFRSTRMLDRILRAFTDARDLSYPSSSILVNEDVYKPFRMRKFVANYRTFFIDYEQEDSLYKKLSFSTDVIRVNLQYYPDIKVPRGLVYSEIKRSDSSLSDKVSINQINVESLGNIVDLSWYKNVETGEVLKDYHLITTKEDLESKVFTPIVRYIIDNKGDVKDKPLISLDTETEGFNLLNLSEENSDRDRITTIQFSWKDDQGVIICLNMDHFENVSPKYVVERFGELFIPRFDGKDFKVKLLFDESGIAIDEEVTLNRKWYNLVGQHSMFDIRAIYSEGVRYWFDHDTLQMAFNINPTNFKRSKGLKQMTRFFFKHETPELSDLLGKGNEGCFHLLKDPEIVRIYGCSDTDYTRKIYYKLLKIMPKKMYNSYSQLDPVTWYECAKAEYYGMRLEEDLVGANAKTIQEDMKLLEDLVYTYVGSILSYRTNLMSKGKLNNFSKGEDSTNEKEDIVMTKENKYVFKLSGNDLRHVLYTILNYPVLGKSEKTGAPSLDSFTMAKLLNITNESSSNILKEDVISSDGKTVILSSKKFNNYKYPLCYILKQFKLLEKEFTTYYKPFLKENLEGRLFKGISTTNIETRRLSSAAQIIKKSLKKAVISHGPDWSLADWDLDQVEARIFTSEAGDVVGIEKLSNPENDYHTENASDMYKIPAHLVDHATRTKSKKIGFGIPYSLGDRKLCEDLFFEVNDKNLAETKLMRKLFETSKQLEMDYLNGIRSRSITPVDVPVEIKRFWGLSDDAKVGLVVSANGFWRYFPLDTVLGDRYKEGVIQRASGNFPIQEYAADLFRFILGRFVKNIHKYGLENKIILHMFIHDEILFSFHKSIDPRLIAKICADSCMFKLKNHTNYFIGLNFGDSWLDCKDDYKELPARLLKEISEDWGTYEPREWTDNPNDIILPLLADFKLKRILDTLEELSPNYKTDGINVSQVTETFVNYKVRSYLYENGLSYSPLMQYSSQAGKEVPKDEDSFLSYLCKLLIDNDLGYVSLMINEEVMSVIDYVKTREIIPSKEDGGFSLLDDEDGDGFESGDFFWSFDSNEDPGEVDYMSMHVTNMYSDNPKDDENSPDNLIKVDNPNYRNILELSRGVTLTVRRLTYYPRVLEFIEKYKSARGKKVFIKSSVGVKSAPVTYDLDLNALDKFLDGLN